MAKQLNETMWIPVEFIRSVSTTESFNKTFEGFLVGTTSFIEAYENTEQRHEQIMGVRRYSGYDSWRHVREKIIKK
jgi:hypothetical protein